MKTLYMLSALFICLVLGSCVGTSPQEHTAYASPSEPPVGWFSNDYILAPSMKINTPGLRVETISRDGHWALMRDYSTDVIAVYEYVDGDYQFADNIEMEFLLALDESYSITAWSYDNNKLAFCSGAYGLSPVVGYLDLVRMDCTLLVNAPRTRWGGVPANFTVAWSADDRSIFYGTNQDGSVTINQVNCNTGKTQTLVEVAPEGWIGDMRTYGDTLYFFYVEDYVGEYILYKLKDGKLTTLAQPEPDMNNVDATLCEVSKDGRYLVYLLTDAYMSYGDNPTRCYLLDIETSTSIRLELPEYNIKWACFTPDDRQVLLATYGWEGDDVGRTLQAFNVQEPGEPKLIFSTVGDGTFFSNEFDKHTGFPSPLYTVGTKCLPDGDIILADQDPIRLTWEQKVFQG